MRQTADGWAWSVAAACLSLGLLFSAVSHAAPPAAGTVETSGKESAEYKRVVARAVREFDAGNYPEARSLFTRAHELYPNARTHLASAWSRSSCATTAAA